VVAVLPHEIGAGTLGRREELAVSRPDDRILADRQQDHRIGNGASQNEQDHHPEESMLQRVPVHGQAPEYLQEFANRRQKHSMHIPPPPTCFSIPSNFERIMNAYAPGGKNQIRPRNRRVA
jgi:hypothetical protein